MKQPDATDQNQKSGKEVAKNPSRYSAGFWRDRIYRPKYAAKGSSHYTEVAEWFARIQHGGRREAVGLKTNNKEEAAQNAANLYESNRSNGWDKALIEFDPGRYAPRSAATVGGFILGLEPLFSGRPATWYHYTYSLRKIAYEIANGQQESNASKFDPFNKPWQKAADKIKLSVVTPQAIQSWKRDCKERAGQDELEQLAANRNINSFMASARILFGKKMMRLLDQNHLEKPLSNPFEGVIFENEGSKKAWKTIWLGQGAGLRRAEIDNLRKDHIDYNRLVIRVSNTPFFRTKTESSEGVVNVDQSMLDELKKYLNGNGPYVIDSEVPPTSRKSRRHYRCQDTFERVVKWLRAHGVDEVKPLHTLRKEFGSIINAQSDIHTACGQLRQSNIRTTSAIYADNRRISTVPMGALLRGKPTKGTEEPEAKARPEPGSGTAQSLRTNLARLKKSLTKH